MIVRTCPKCRSNDVRTRYHRSAFLCKAWSAFTNNHSDGEHLHHFCELCGYDWTALPADVEEPKEGVA
jgi:hypothetical protein